MRRKKRMTEDQGLFSAAEHGSEAGPTPSRLMPADIQQREFRLGFRGYQEAEVDEFLDEVTEELARLHEEASRLRDENRLLREGAGYPTTPFGGGPDLADAGRQAERILDEARERADRIVRDAEARAAGAAVAAGGVAGGPGVLSPFLGREREFLQGLASLIGQHAEFVKTTARSVRRSAAAPAGPAEDAGGAGEAAPASAAHAESSSSGTTQEAGSEEADAGPASDRGTSEEAHAEPPDRVGDTPEGADSIDAPPGSDRGGPVAGGPEPEDAAPPAPERTSSRPLEPADLSPWRGVQTAPARRDTTSEPTQAWESPFAEEASSLEEPGAVSSSIEGGREKRENDRSLRELFWGEE
jgi:DivIVA domain-containing protein